MKSHEIDLKRLRTYNVLGGTTFVLSLLFVFGILSPRILTPGAQDKIACLLAKLTPALIPNGKPDYAFIMIGWLIFLGVVIAVLAIALMSYQDLTQYNVRKQSNNINGLRLGINIWLIVVGLIYFGLSHDSLTIRILIALGQYMFFRTLAYKMLIDPLDRLSRVFRRLGLDTRLSTESNAYDTHPTIGEGQYSGLKVRVTEVAKRIDQEGPHLQFYVIQVEAGERNLDLIVQKDILKSKNGRKPISGFHGLSKTLSRYNAVSNDPVRARDMIKSNLSNVELLIAGSTNLLLNIPVNESVVGEQEDYFSGLGTLTLIRDGSIAGNEYTFTRMLNALVELSRSLSSATKAY